LLLWLVIFCLSLDVLSLSMKLFTDFRNYRDVGYPDSAVILRVSEFVQTGHLYPAVTQPPYYPTLYSPLGYVIYSVPYRLAVHYSLNPDGAFRLTGLVFFLGSLVLVFFIIRRLGLPIQFGLLGVLFAASGTELRLWPMQARPDMMALCFALLGLWLCLGSERRWELTLAAIFAALALLCKQTFVAMPVAVFLWFLIRRRFMTAVCWAVGVASLVVTVYGFFIIREPLAWQHFAVLSRPIFEFRDGLRILLRAIFETKSVFFLFGAYFLLRRHVAKAHLIILYGLLAWIAAVLTLPQAGGAINYFFEFWAASAILAAPGLIELNRQLPRTPVGITGLLLVLMLFFFVPKLRNDVASIRDSHQVNLDYARTQADWNQFHSALVGKRLLAFEPLITRWSRIPEVPDPFLAATLVRKGTWSSAPVVRNIDDGIYEAIVSQDVDHYRGVTNPDPSFTEAIEQHYHPACNILEYTIWLPAQGSPGLYQHLVQAGCEPVGKNP
jgi:hypothetical protein